MTDQKLCEAFGTTLEEVDADCELYESGDLAGLKFGKPIDGRPQARTRTTSLKMFDFELEAIDRAAAKEGISRSAFIRRACDNEILATMA